MPGCPRNEIVIEGEVGTYHVWTRCVRRAFLCGEDKLTGRNFDHRRDWIRQYLPRLCKLFAVEAGFHVEMSNHLHLILRTRPDVADTWSDEDVVTKWKTISRLIHSRDGQATRPITAGDIAAELAKPGRIKKLRKNLSSVSQFMKALCEHISRRSNREDKCTGAFWEGRFDCRRLESEGAILVCAMYIDLNQIRDGEALTPEESTRTSAYDRICGRIQRRNLHQQGIPRTGMPKSTAHVAPVDEWLCELTLDERTEAYQGAAPSASPWRASDKGMLPVTLEDYLRLLDWSGRQVKDSKPGSIPSHLTPILERLHINGDMWIDLVTKFDKLFTRIVGKSQQLVDRAIKAGRRCYRGRANCAAAFG